MNSMMHDKEPQQRTFNDARSSIVATIRNIKPFDERERLHIQDTIEWINSGAEIFRIKKPDIPPKHLGTYFVVLNDACTEMLLVDHKKAQLWIPPGGHVDLNEHPTSTIKRECQEELGIEANFIFPEPIFLTQSRVGDVACTHVDVNIWYALRCSNKEMINFDPNEFNDVQWILLDELPFDKTDRDLKRFVRKLLTLRSTC